MIRLKTSRPMWSVPRMYCEVPRASHAGGRYLKRRFPTSGLCGARKSANTAVKTSKLRRPSAMTGAPRSLAATRPQKDRTTGRWASISVGAITGLLSIANPRINVGVENVHQEIDRHDRHPAQDGGRLHYREISKRDAFIGQPANPRPGENRLDHHRAIHD